MHRLTRAGSLTLVFVLGCGTEKEGSPGDAMAALPQGPIDTGPEDPPANAPLPPAMCGDQNGGGDQHVDFPTLKANKVAEKDAAMTRQLALLELRYDLRDRSGSLQMTRGKPVQQGVRVRLPEGLSWQA